MRLAWLLIVPLAAFAAPQVHADCPDGPPGMRPPPPVHELIDDRAEELGIDADTVAKIDQLAADARPDMEAAQSELRAAHEAFDQAISADHPDRGAVLAASRDLGEAEQAMRDQHLEVELAIRALLTPEQWRAVAPPRPPGPPLGPPPSRGAR